MSILNKITGFLSGGVVDAASGVADIVERWKPGETTKHEMEMDVANLVKGAREHDSPVAGGGFLGGLADGINRLIRPVVTLYVLGGLFGFFDPQLNSNIDPWFLAQGEKIIIFWFGGKVLLKDLPAAIKYLRRK
jgi:hypothetical protein